jgi:solute carrier family 50 protein (sugar transporter)
MVSAKSVILEYVCPSAGIIIGNAMFAAPCRDLQLAIKGGNLGDLNPTPWAFMLGNCFGWVFYSMLLKNYWIFFGNAPGLILSVWLNMGAGRSRSFAV